MFNLSCLVVHLQPISVYLKVNFLFSLQIPQPGWDKLFVSFIPAETGKATAKTTKASVRNGNCKWSDPIYETTRLLLDTRNRKYEEKLYKLVVSMVYTILWLQFSV